MVRVGKNWRHKSPNGLIEDYGVVISSKICHNYAYMVMVSFCGQRTSVHANGSRGMWHRFPGLALFTRTERIDCYSPYRKIPIVPFTGVPSPQICISRAHAQELNSIVQKHTNQEMPENIKHSENYSCSRIHFSGGIAIPRSFYCVHSRWQ